MTNFENKETSFKKYTGGETKIKVISEIPINEGSFGIIFDTIVEIGNHRKRFIVKKYSDNRIRDISVVENTEQAFENYSLAKKSGLKVLPTFRINNDRKSILMTTGFSDNQICIGSNNRRNVLDFKRPLIEKIQDVDQFLDDIFAEGLKAAQNGIGFYTDNFFFILSKNEPTKVDFVLGDLDNLDKREPTKQIGFRNIEFIKLVLDSFFYQNVSPEKINDLRDKLKCHYEQAVDDVANSGLK